MSTISTHSSAITPAFTSSVFHPSQSKIREWVQKCESIPLSSITGSNAKLVEAIKEIPQDLDCDHTLLKQEGERLEKIFGHLGKDEFNDVAKWTYSEITQVKKGNSQSILRIFDEGTRPEVILLDRDRDDYAKMFAPWQFLFAPLKKAFKQNDREAYFAELSNKASALWSLGSFLQRVEQKCGRPIG